MIFHVYKTYDDDNILMCYQYELVFVKTIVYNYIYMKPAIYKVCEFHKQWSVENMLILFDQFNATVRRCLCRFNG